MKLVVDGRTIEAAPGTSVLQACLANGIDIPNLCFLEDMQDPPAACRLCFVEVEGLPRPVTSCTLKAEEQMVVRTDTSAVRRLQKTGLELLLSVHDIDCKNCPANRNCALQNIAKKLGVGLKSKRFETRLKAVPDKDAHPSIAFNPNRCVLCGRCIYVCQKKNDKAEMDFAKRGFETIISFYGNQEDAWSRCTDCRACIEICPVGALQGVDTVT